MQSRAAPRKTPARGNGLTLEHEGSSIVKAGRAAETICGIPLRGVCRVSETASPWRRVTPKFGSGAGNRVGPMSRWQEFKMLLLSFAISVGLTAAGALLAIGMAHLSEVASNKKPARARQQGGLTPSRQAVKQARNRDHHFSDPCGQTKNQQHIPQKHRHIPACDSCDSFSHRGQIVGSAQRSIRLSGNRYAGTEPRMTLLLCE